MPEREKEAPIRTVDRIKQEMVDYFKTESDRQGRLLAYFQYYDQERLIEDRIEILKFLATAEKSTEDQRLEVAHKKSELRVNEFETAMLNREIKRNIVIEPGYSAAQDYIIGADESMIHACLDETQEKLKDVPEKTIRAESRMKYKEAVSLVREELYKLL
jgi:hypothetical protein